MRFVDLEHRQKTTWQTIDVRLFRMKTIQSCEISFQPNCSSHILCGIIAFRQGNPFSGQDAVQTPTRLHPQSSSMPLRTQLSRRLKVHQLLMTQHPNLIIFGNMLLM